MGRGDLDRRADFLGARPAPDRSAEVGGERLPALQRHERGDGEELPDAWGEGGAREDPSVGVPGDPALEGGVEVGEVTALSKSARPAAASPSSSSEAGDSTVPTTSP